MKKLFYLLLAISMFSCGDLILTGCNSPAPVKDSTVTEKVIQPQAMAATVAQVCHHTGMRDSSYSVIGKRDSSYKVTIKVDSAYTAKTKVSYDSIVPCVPIAQRERKALYIDKTNQCLVNAITPNDMALLNLMFDPTKRHANNQTNFNEAWCYDMDAVFASANLKKLFGDWVSMRHKADPLFQVGCVESFSSAYAYNLAQTDTTRRIDLLVCESEYWRATDQLAAFVADSADMVKTKTLYLGKAGIKGIEFYNGHFLTTYKSRAPRWFAKWPISLHDYNTNPATEYIYYRLDSLNAAAGIYYKPISSIESDFWGPQVKAIGYDSCLALQKSVFLRHHFTNLKWVGTVCFDREHYEYYSFTTTGVLRMQYQIATPKYLTNPNHLNEGKYSDN